MDLRIPTPLADTDPLRTYVKRGIGRKPSLKSQEVIKILNSLDIGIPVLIDGPQWKAFNMVIIQLSSNRGIKSAPELDNKKFRRMKVFELDQFIIIRVK